MSSHVRSRGLSRRSALRLIGAGAGLSLLAACAPSTQPAPPAAPPAATQPAGGKPAATQPAAQTAPQPGAQKVPVRWFFWTATEEERLFWEGLAQDAMQQIPSVDVKFETDTFANFWTKLPTMAAANSLPDLIGLQSLRTGTFTSRGLYQPLDELIAADKDVNVDDFNKGIRDGLSYKGKIYALAYDFGPHIMYINKTLFEKAGAPLPKDDWTWDDFVGTAKALTREIDGRRVSGFVAPNDFGAIVPWIFSNGGDYVDADFKTSQLSKPETVEAIQWYADLVHTLKVAPTLDDPGNAQWGPEQFYTGRVAMFTTGPWNFVNARSKLKDVWDIAPLPRGKAGSISWVAGSGFGIAATSRVKNEAWQVLKYVTSTEGLNKVAAAGRGYPGRASSVPAFYRKDVLPERQEIVAKQAETARPFRTNSTWQEITTQLLSDLVDPVVVSGKPAAETVKSADARYQELLDKGQQA